MVSKTSLVSLSFFASSWWITVDMLVISGVVRSEANYHFRGPRLFLIGCPSVRFATTDGIQISTIRTRYIH